MSRERKKFAMNGKNNLGGWSAGVFVVASAVAISSCGNGETDGNQNSRAVLTSLEPTGDIETTSLDPSPTTATETVGGGGSDVPRSGEPTEGNSDDLRALAEELFTDDDIGRQDEGRGSIDGRVVEPGYQDQYPSDPMDNETMPETRSRSKPGLDCMDSELGDVRENLGRPVTCADVGDGPQWVEGEPYW